MNTGCPEQCKWQEESPRSWDLIPALPLPHCESLGSFFIEMYACLLITIKGKDTTFIRISSGSMHPPCKQAFTEHLLCSGQCWLPYKCVAYLILTIALGTG